MQSTEKSQGECRDNSMLYSDYTSIAVTVVLISCYKEEEYREVARRVPYETQNSILTPLVLA